MNTDGCSGWMVLPEKCSQSREGSEMSSEPCGTGCIFNQQQKKFSGSNTDGSFTTAVSNSFLSPLEQEPIEADLG